MALRDQVLKAFPFLFEQAGFVFVGPEGDDDEVIVIAESADLRLRFIRDRADFFLDVGSSKNSQKWIGSYDLLDEMKSKGLVCETYKYSNRIGSVSSILRKTLPAIREYLA